VTCVVCMRVRGIVGREGEQGEIVEGKEGEAGGWCITVYAAGVALKGLFSGGKAEEVRQRDGREGCMCVSLLLLCVWRGKGVGGRGRWMVE